MQTALKALAFLLLLVGAVWALQGLGLVGGSFMTGRSEWLYIGIVTAIAGAGLLFTAGRR